jgi:Ca-activated chloride channel homolog
MRPLLASCLTAALLLGPVAALAPPRAQAQPADYDARVTQVDISAYPEVTLYIAVHDAAGNPVGGLGRDSFALREDGQPVTIDGFDGGGGGPIHTALVLDRSGSMAGEGKLEGALEAARAFVAAMRPGDRTALIAFSERPELVQPFTGDQEALDEAIDEVWPDGGTALYDSIVAGIDALAGQQGRRALLVLTDGQDCREANQCPDEAGSRTSLERAIAQAREQGQAVHVVGLGAADGDEADGIDEPVLRRIAEQSGGEYFYAPEAAQLAALYTRLAGGLQQEYRVSYSSPRPFYDGTRRDIQVTVAGGAAVADSGYVERHLIDVRSNPVVGVLLLGPLLAALALPLLVARERRRRQPPTPASAGVGLVAFEAATPRRAVHVISAEGEGGEHRPQAHFCERCGTALRPAARFCTGCGHKLGATLSGASRP